MNNIIEQIAIKNGVSVKKGNKQSNRRRYEKSK